MPIIMLIQTHNIGSRVAFDNAQKRAIKNPMVIPIISWLNIPPVATPIELPIEPPHLAMPVILCIGLSLAIPIIFNFDPWPCPNNEYFDPCG
jgi:hypothetical protein